MRKKKQGSSYSNKRTRSIIYIAVMGFCIILLAVMVILSAQQIQKNQILINLINIIQKEIIINE